MPQFSVYRNKNPRSRDEIPFLLDVQHDLLEGLDTRVVVPLGRRANLRGKPITRLSPVLAVEGEPLVMMTPQLAGVAARDLGKPVSSLAAHRAEIIAALDLLISGF
jgi:toxin CcdB